MGEKINLLKMFKSLTKEEKKEFADLIKKEIKIDMTINIPKHKINWKKLSLKKSQLFGQ